MMNIEDKIDMFIRSYTKALEKNPTGAISMDAHYKSIIDLLELIKE